MKKIYSLLAAFLLTLSAGAQTLNVNTSDGTTWQFPAASTGEMNYADGTSLTIMSKVFTVSDISSMSVDESTVTNNLVSIAYSNSGSATVTVAGNVAQYVTPSISGNHVTITTTNTDAVDDDEITVQLSGETSDGSLTLAGSYKTTISLAGVTLTNPSGAAITVTNSKRIQLSAKSGYTNTITDGSGSQKACIYSKGQLQIQGNGTLNVVGNYKHGIKSASYISIKNLTLNITAAPGDGINCEEYLQMKSGTVTISGVSDDGIQCDLGGTATTGETTDHEDEDSGNIYLEGGTLTVTTTADASKGVKSEGDIIVSDGTYTVTTSGSYEYDSDDADYKSCAAMKADGNMTVSGGTLTLKSTGYAGKGINIDGALTVSDGTITATATGSSSDTYGSAKGIKAEGAITISGGTVTASSSSHEGIESKSTITISGGYVYSAASDDAINAASDLTISGGYVMAYASGNDGIDANGNMYIKGGNVLAIGASSPEVALDAAEGKTLSITGGNLVAIGGLEQGASVSNGTAYQASSYSQGTTYGLYNGSTLAFAFTVPSSGGNRAPGGGGSSGMGTPMVVYTTGSTSLKSGVTGSGTNFWSGYGYTSCSGGSSVSLSSYSSGGSGGGPGGW